MLLEIFNQMVSYNQIEDGEFSKRYRFNIADNTYEVHLDKMSENRWVVSFYYIDKSKDSIFNKIYNINRTGNSFLVFSNVIKIVKDFIIEYKPEIITFASDNNEISRIKLYDSIVRRIGKPFRKYNDGGDIIWEIDLTNKY